MQEGLPEVNRETVSAALKAHKVLSVGCGAPVRYHFSPAREHDRPHLQIDESRQGCGLLADLAYASLVRLRACEEHGVRFVIRLKDNWEPKVEFLARGQVIHEFFSGMVLDGWGIDADVHVGGPEHPLHLRLVGIHTPKGYCFFGGVLDLDFRCLVYHADALFEGGMPWYSFQFPVPTVRAIRW